MNCVFGIFASLVGSFFSELSSGPPRVLRTNKVRGRHINNKNIIDYIDIIKVLK